MKELKEIFRICYADNSRIIFYQKDTDTDTYIENVDNEGRCTFSIITEEELKSLLR